MFLKVGFDQTRFRKKDRHIVYIYINMNNMIKALGCALSRRVVLFQVTGKRAELARFLEQGLKETLQLDCGLTWDQ